MKVGTATLTALLSLVARNVAAAIAPDVTVFADGFNVIAKVPCAGCPFLYQDTSQGSNEPWAERKDENALVIIFLLSFSFFGRILS